MSLSPLPTLLEYYAARLMDIEIATEKVSPEQVLDLLIARDRIETVLTDRAGYDAASLQKLLHLDQRLKQQGTWIATHLDLPNCRNSMNPAPDAWWWWFNPPSDWRDRYDWLWGALCVPLMTLSGALLFDLSGRFLAGGIDTFGALTVVSQSILTLLTASGTFTKSGEAGIERVLNRFDVPSYHLQEVKFALALLLFLGLFGIRSSLPSIAKVYLQQATKAQQEKQLVLAQIYYQRALQLDSANPQAQYALGTLYEMLQNPDAAQSVYQIAAQSGFKPAMNQLARLYLLKNQPDKAVSLLINSVDQGDAADIQYATHKNLGWARFQQNWYAAAKTELRAAIAIHPRQADAHCLLAQVLSSKKNPSAAQSEWRLCLASADSRLPEHDRWIQLGQQDQESSHKTPPLDRVVR